MNGDGRETARAQSTRDTNLRELLTQREHEAAVLRHELERSRRTETLGLMALGSLHDFNNALTCVVTLNQLSAGAEPDEAREFRTEIADSARRAARISRQILTLGRDGSADHEVICVDSTLAELHGAIKSLLGPTTTSHCDFTSDSSIEADPIQFGQVILNLAINARDAMPDGGTISLVTRLVDKQVEIVVADTGDGIAADAMSKVFKPFYSTKNSGTGLGLPQVQRIVESSGGSVAIESRPNEGTTVRIRLPKVTASNSATTKTHTNDLPRGSERILLIEPDPAVLRSITALLQTHGYCVVATSSEAQAIALDPSVDVLWAFAPSDQLQGALVARNAQLAVLRSDSLTQPYSPKEITKRLRELLADA